MIPGEYVLLDDDVIANVRRATVELTVANTGDRPIQVGSHFHFFEANRALRFDRAQAFGMRLNTRAVEKAFAEGKGPDPATQDNATGGGGDN